MTFKGLFKNNVGLYTAPAVPPLRKQNTRDKKTKAIPE
jgi:hypothetical protein